MHREDEFDKNMKERLKVSLIGNMPISNEQKMQLRSQGLRSDISTPARESIGDLEVDVNF